jgi:hypothetical protein
MGRLRTCRRGPPLTGYVVAAVSPADNLTSASGAANSLLDPQAVPRVVYFFRAAEPLGPAKLTSSVVACDLPSRVGRARGGMPVGLHVNASWPAGRVVRGRPPTPGQRSTELK